MNATAEEPLLVATGLRKSYGPTPALDGAGLTVGAARW